MAVLIDCASPKKLLQEFHALIDDGTIKTWPYDTHKDFTHVSDQWKFKAWFRPTIEDGRLVFSIIRPKAKTISTATYAFFHGHLLQTFLDHFDKQFTWLYASALPKKGDLV
jgi:hypothetical protein